jgi:RimJ/RimL family protein N-acetyltransferase
LRCRGIATAAVRELLREAFSASEVHAVLAQTLAEPNPSARVLEKAGFSFEDEVPGDEIGKAWRFRHDRERA